MAGVDGKPGETRDYIITVRFAAKNDRDAWFVSRELREGLTAAFSPWRKADISPATPAMLSREVSA